MENKMETAIVYGGLIGIMENGNYYSILGEVVGASRLWRHQRLGSRIPRGSGSRVSGQRGSGFTVEGSRARGLFF